MVTQQYSLQYIYAAVLQDRPQLNMCMLPLVSLPSNAEKAIVPDVKNLPTMQLCSSCQNFVALGAVSTYPVAIAMPRMTNGRSMPNMPTIAIGSLRGAKPPADSAFVMKNSSGSSSADMKPLLLSLSPSPPPPSFARVRMDRER